jgi:uncharacterized protein (TIGR02001 family)
MNLSKISALCFAATTLLAASSAMAWESESGAHSTSASVALGSDYMWRGYSQTDDKPAISGSFDYGHSSGFYAGTWASNVDFDDDTSIEIDIYAGFGGEFGDSGVGYDFGVLRYIYPGENYDWNEVYGSLSYSYFSIGIAHSGSVYDSSEDGTYYSVGFDYDLPAGFALSAGLGYYDYASDYSDNDPLDYRVGVSKDLAGFVFDLSYIGVDSDGDDEYGDAADSRLVFTISKSL